MISYPREDARTRTFTFCVQHTTPVSRLTRAGVAAASRGSENAPHCMKSDNIIDSASQHLRPPIKHLLYAEVSLHYRLSRAIEKQ